MALDVNLNVTSVPDPRLDLILAQLAIVIKNQEQLLMTGQEELDLLKSIDTATTAVGGNLTAIGVTTKSIADAGATIKTELDNILGQISNNPAVPQSVSDAVTALSAKVTNMAAAAQLATDALGLQVPVLEAIATQGASNPVPINPPPPPPPAGS